MQYIDGPTWIILIGGLIALVFSLITGIKEKNSRTLKILCTIAAFGGLISIGGGIWSECKQKVSAERSARQDIIRMNQLLSPTIEEYQSRIQEMLGDRKVQENFEFALVAKILNEIDNPDDDRRSRVKLYDLYFDSQMKLRNAIGDSLGMFDRARYPQLADLLTSQLATIDKTAPEKMRKKIEKDSKEKIKAIQNGKLQTILARQMQIRAHDYDGKDEPGILQPYFDLYSLINKSIMFKPTFPTFFSAFF